MKIFVTFRTKFYGVLHYTSIRVLSIQQGIVSKLHMGNISNKSRTSKRYISSTDTYKQHLALISAKVLERERERTLY